MLPDASIVILDIEMDDNDGGCFNPKIHTHLPGVFALISSTLLITITGLVVFGGRTHRADDDDDDGGGRISAASSCLL